MVEDVKRLAEKIDRLEEHRLDQIEHKLDEVIAHQREQDRIMERYSARWGIIIMVASAIIAALKFFWQDFIRFAK